MSHQTNITPLLLASGQGDDKTREALIAQLYDQLHELAHYQIRRTGGPHTLCTTAVVNEAYLKLFGRQSIQWQNRAHFIHDLSPL